MLGRQLFRLLVGLTVCILIWHIYVMELSIIPTKIGFLNLKFKFHDVNRYQQKMEKQQEEEQQEDGQQKEEQKEMERVQEEEKQDEEKNLEEKREEEQQEEEKELAKIREEEQQEEKIQDKEQQQEEIQEENQPQQKPLPVLSSATNVDTQISGQSNISRSHYSTQLNDTNENKNRSTNSINNTIYYTSSLLTNISYNLSLDSYPYSAVNYEILPNDDIGKLIDIYKFEYIINQNPCSGISLSPSPTINNISVSSFNFDTEKGTNNSYPKQVTDPGSPILLIFVHSAPGRFNKRMLIRETWGSPANKTNKIRLLFLVGAGTETVDQENLENENEIYSDIVQGNFIDSYRNMTYKHVMALKWFTYFCPNAKYVLKMDDDVFANTPKLVDYLSTVADRHNLLYCQPKYDAPVQRNQTQWTVTKEEYAGDFYPPYCPGYFILYSADVAFRLYLQAQKSRFFWIDDVHVTGTLAKQANVTITSAIPNILYSEELVDILNGKIDINNSTFLFSYVYIDEEQISKLWEKVENSGHPLFADSSENVNSKKHG